MTAFILLTTGFVGGITCILLALRMQHKTELKALFNYYNYILMFCILAFVNLVAGYIAFDVMLAAPARSFVTVRTVSSVIQLPLAPLPFYFFMLFLAGMVEIEISGKLKIIFQLFYLIYLCFVFAGTYHFIEYNNPGLLKRVAQVINGTTEIFDFLLAGGTIVYSWKKRNLLRRKQSSVFCLLHLFFFALFIFFTDLPLDLMSREFTAPILVNLFVLHLLIPLLYLQSQLKKFPARFKNPSKISGKTAELFRFKGITPRENEIIRLVAMGLSNSDIEERLFISLKTVKSHIYRIYRKLGIRNRVQLVNLLGPENGQKAKNIDKPGKG